MYIVIAGGGLVGLALTEQLLAHGHDVVVIDPDAAVTEYAHVELGAMVHTGSATDPRSLEAVGLGRADIACAMMRSDAANLAFTLLARSFGVPNRLVRMREDNFEEAYRLAGATTVASSVRPLVDQLVVSIEHPQITSLMRLTKGNIDVFEVPVPEDSEVAGMTVEAISRRPGFPPACNFVGVETPNGVEIARGTTEVPGGSTVIMLAMEVDLDQIVRLLTRRRPRP
ncbi:MAG: TrkA family potassium uptake protein [Candidatus Sericytochromatia bacterium]|nr:TrkA family potassium uptake protein [Candidatus Sericytochromatia bacterium]